MSAQIYDHIIIGAGITGLSLGWELSRLKPRLRILVLEKSKSCGGRVATRRIGELKFDHGAQFIKSTQVSEKLLWFWQSQGVLQQFPPTVSDAFCGVGGMTQLTKKMAEDLEVSYHFEVSRLENSNNAWKVIGDRGAVLETRQVTLTCPLPQSLEILQSSNIAFDLALSKLQYSKGLVLLLEVPSEIDPGVSYLEEVDGDIAAVSAQHKKGYSSQPSYAILMSKQWSEIYFNHSENEILGAAQELLVKKFGSLKFESIQLKKWRYCMPQKIWEKTYYQPQGGLYLAGDAFGGPDLNGALKSAYGLLDDLK